jgi:hypothetical protein
MRPPRRLSSQASYARARLAAGPDGQGAYLRDLGTWPSLDERALELDDVAEASNAWVSPTLCAVVERLSARLGQMRRGERLPMGAAALRGPEWACVRSLAQQALAAVDEHD